MITPAENAEARRYFARFMGQCDAYKTLLTTAGLPLSIDLAALQAAYRQHLFDGLLTVDPGLKARYELLRTPEARQQLVTDVINLDGHEPIGAVTTALRQLEATYNQLSIPGEGPLHRDLPLSSFAQYYDLDFGRVLDNHTLDWEQHAHVLAYFERLAATLTPWLQIVRKTMNSGASMQDAGQLLADFFTVEGAGLATGKVAVKVKVLHARMQSQKLHLHVPRE